MWRWSPCCCTYLRPFFNIRPMLFCKVIPLVRLILGPQEGPSFDLFNAFLSFYFKSHKYFNFIPKNCKLKLIFFPVCIILDCGLSLRSFCLWRSKALERLKRPVCKNCGWNISRAIAAILLCPCRVTWWHPDTSTGLWTLPTHRFTTGEKPSVAFQSPKFFDWNIFLRKAQLFDVLISNFYLVV